MEGRRQCSEADGKWTNAPIFNFNGELVKFNANWYDNPNENYGSVSGFVPKFLLVAVTKRPLKRWALSLPLLC